MSRRKLNSSLCHAALGLCAVSLCALDVFAIHELPQPSVNAGFNIPQPPTKQVVLQSIRCEPSKGGFLLLGKTPLLPPYEIKYEGLNCQINGLPIDLALLVYPGRGNKTVNRSAQNAATRLAQQLERGRSLVQFRDRSAILLDRETDAYYLLKAIVSIHSGTKPEDVDLTRLVFFRSADAWRSWLRDFEPTRSA